jgi:MFS family permease
LSVDPMLWMMGADIPTRAFGAGWVDYRILTTTTAVMLVACMLVGGLLGDYYGRRRVLLFGAVTATVFGALTALAPDRAWFVVARSIAVGSAAVALPLTLAVIRLEYAGRARVRALFVYTLAISVGLILSFFAVYIEEVAGWRATLILPTAATAIGSVLVWRYVSESRASAGVLEQATTAVAWSLTLLPLTLGFLVARLNDTWANPITIVALVLSVLGLVALALVWRGRVRTSMTTGVGHGKRHLLTVMLLTAAALCFGVTGYVLQVYGFLTAVKFYGAVQAALALAPVLLGALLVAGWAMRASQTMQARRLIGGGLGVMALSMAATSFVRPDTSYWWLVPPLVLFGTGYLAAQTAWTAAFMSAMPDAVVGASAGVTKATMATGASLAGVLLSSIVLFVGQADLIQALTTQELTPAQVAAAVVALNTALAADAALNLAVPPGFDQALMVAYLDAYTVGFSASMWTGAALCLAAAALAWFVLPRANGPAA